MNIHLGWEILFPLLREPTLFLPWFQYLPNFLAIRYVSLVSTDIFSLLKLKFCKRHAISWGLNYPVLFHIDGYYGKLYLCDPCVTKRQSVYPVGSDLLICGHASPPVSLCGNLLNHPYVQDF